VHLRIICKERVFLKLVVRNVCCYKYDYFVATNLGISTKLTSLSPFYNVYRAKDENYFSDYYDNLFGTWVFKEEIIRHSKGIWSSCWRFYPEEFCEIRIPIPLVEEQKKIGGHITVE